jgi:predicted alpha-1,2-mannosidase
LIDLMGGRKEFVARLDQLFIEPCGTAKWHFLGQFPDSTGLIGQFVTGNEPSFHIPYLYCYAGAPWKTQRRVRQIMDLWFDDTPLGLCGDEDGGAMSAWHIFNSIGFLPTCPGEPYYVLGSPVFERVELHPPDGPVFTLTAEGSSPQFKYVQRATLNGVHHERPWFPHEAIQKGGELTLEMGPRPNMAWGSRPADAPPSLSDGSRTRW